jgi:hypothetical protein
MINPPAKLFFILSTGRTGTHFFENYINSTCPEYVCLHEPHPSRRFKIFSNMYLQGRISEKFVYKRYVKARKKYFKKYQNISYVESNNFMFGCIPALSRYLPELHVLHIVRNPFEYIMSHLNHGFWSGKKKIVAKYVPYWLEDIESGRDPVRLLANRWFYVNECISGYATFTKYLRVRFEDLFLGDEEKTSDTINKVRCFLGCSGLSVSENNNYIKKPSNASRASKQADVLNSENIAYVNARLGVTMKNFGYTPR